MSTENVDNEVFAANSLRHKLTAGVLAIALVLGTFLFESHLSNVRAANPPVTGSGCVQACAPLRVASFDDHNCNCVPPPGPPTPVPPPAVLPPVPIVVPNLHCTCSPEPMPEFKAAEVKAPEKK